MSVSAGVGEVLEPDIGGQGVERLAIGEQQDLREEIAALQARADCGLLNTREKLLLARHYLHCGKPDAALAAILPLLSKTEPHPLAIYIRGLVRLRKGRGEGVHDLLAAAARRPMLMARAVARVETWLAGAGRRYDCPALRAELNNLRALHAAAMAEREALRDPVVLKPPELSAAAEQAICDALAPYAGKVTLGWLAARPCDRLPVWRHHEILLEASPGLFWPPRGVVARLEKLEHAARAALPEMPDTSLSLRIWPLRVPAHFRRQMRRAAGRPFLAGGDAASVS